MPQKKIVAGIFIVIISYLIGYSLSWARPTDFGASKLYHHACSAKGKCTAVGYYTNVAKITKPLTYISSDFGNTWNVSCRLPSFPPGALESELDGVSCKKDGGCVAVGYYKNAAGENAALAYRSEDFGEHWLSPVYPGSKEIEAGMLFGVNCKKNHCVAVGQYYNGMRSSVEPLILISSDLGKHWNSPTSLPIAPLSDSSRLWSVTCNSKGICAAVGENTGVGDTGEFKPLVYTSNDFGNRWTLPVLPLPPSGALNSGLYSISCNEKGLCTSVGLEGNVWDGSLAYTSIDFGKNWSAPILPPQSNSWTLLALRCSL